MVLPIEGQLGPPPQYVLPNVTPTSVSEHPLLRLAARSRTGLQAAGLDPLDELLRAAKRAAQTPHRRWGLSPEHLPDFLLIGRISGEHLRLPPELFVGLPCLPWKLPSAAHLLARSRGTIVNQELITISGEVVQADLQGVIFTRFLDLERAALGDTQPPADWWTLRHYLNPRRTIEPAGPQLFTWSSVFNNARDLWPGVAGGEQIQCLTLDHQVSLANHFLGYGLEALAAESGDRYIRLAAGRLIDLCERGLVDLHLTRSAAQALEELETSGRTTAKSYLLEAHGLAFLTSGSAGRRDSKGTLLIPLSWIAMAMEREIVALAHLVRVASLARDWYFGQLAGTAAVVCRELRQSAEISFFDAAQARADGLAARFLDEAAALDNQIYGLQLNRDRYCLEVQRTPSRVGCYDDPPVPRSRWPDDGPGRGPDDDSSHVPYPPGRPSAGA
jgi:hypothetical protein